MKKIIASLLLVLTLSLVAGACTGDHDSDVVSKNLSTEADQFHVQRRIVFYNGITGEYMMVIEGLCALGNNDPKDELSLVCKTGPDSYIKDFLGLSDNVTYFVEQLQGVSVSKYHYEVIFKPETIIPDINVGGG